MTTASQEAFSKEIYQQLEQRSATQERSFYMAFVTGKLGPERLKEYYRHLYHECTNFVRLVSAVHTFAEERDQRMVIAQNFLEEYAFGAAGQDHPSLAMNVGKSLGMSEEEIEAHEVYPEIQAVYDQLRTLSFQSFLQGLAVLVTVEADLPKRHTHMRSALLAHYGVRAEDLKYYDEHREGGGSSIQDGSGYGGDDVHVAREVELLAKYARTEEERAKVLEAIATVFECRDRIVKSLNKHLLTQNNEVQ